jgi:hypothetical protein
MMRSLLVIIGSTTALGWLAIAMPFDGDQALFTVMARDCQDGRQMYRDQWDITNPGLLLFYRLAGSLFGYHETGIRIFEIGYWIVFMLCLSAVIRKQQRLTFWPVSPVVFVAMIEFATGSGVPTHFTKTEGLVAFPMAMALLLSLLASQKESNRSIAVWAMLAGLAGGLVLLFKLLFSVCLAVVWGWAIIVSLRRNGLKKTLGFVAFLFLGVSTVLAVAVVSFVLAGTWPIVWRTLFELPPQFLAEGHRGDGERLTNSVRWLISAYGGLMAIALVAGYARYRECRDPVVIAIGFSLIAATIVILIQRTSWWSYHFQLLGLPIGMLASYGWPTVDRLIRQTTLTRGDRSAVFLVVAMLLIQPIGSALVSIRQLASHRFGMSEADRESLRHELSRDYRDIENDVVWLKTCEPGPILVCGNPLIFLKADRPTATAIHGWSMELYPATVREEFINQIIRARPRLIYVDRLRYGIEDLILARYPGLDHFLKTEMTVRRTTETGTWYQGKSRE